MRVQRKKDELIEVAVLSAWRAIDTFVNDDIPSDVWYCPSAGIGGFYNSVSNTIESAFPPELWWIEWKFPVFFDTLGDQQF